MRGTTPTALLREAQLRHAHTLLEAADPLRETVTGIAQRAGFTHLGRFSTEYRRRFAESPGDTLRR
ncbi:helix-turn-helix domain-containing protein [Leucobacter luti]|uniref:helix-turn-helix domain-containing protein n=1 Tax=Leucobacter luti TaxID=340320 RepID=UPI0037BE7BEB